MKSIHRILSAVVLASALLAPARADPPATFSIIFGSALLCLDQINSAYFYDYLSSTLGQPYKTELGAYWFSATRNRQSGLGLWGLQVADILVNDSSSPAEFIGAVINATPQELADAITHHTGFRFTLENTNQAYSLRQSRTGSVIAYAGNRAKIYCAKSMYLVPKLEY